MTTETGEAALSLDLLPFTRADIEQTVPVRFEQVVRRSPITLHWLAAASAGLISI